MVNEEQRTFEYEIPGELMYKEDGAVSDHVAVETFRFYVNTQCLSDRGLHSSQVCSFLCMNCILTSKLDWHHTLACCPG